MTAKVDIVNRALQAVGSRTTVTQSELDNDSSNEAIQANLIYDALRQQLLRMAPWDCAFNTMNLVYITSSPGTPENTSPATALWEKGQPPPPWAYEYQYPVDCLRACWVIPATQTGFTGVPVTTAVTGYSPSILAAKAVKFKVQVDQFYPITAATVSAGGTGYAIGDIITLAEGDAGDPPIGAPAQLRVLTLTGSAVATVEVVNHILNSATPKGGSYFAPQTNPIAQGETSGSGTGATFTCTFGSKGSQRVILTNQEYASLAYVMDVTDPDIWDPLFQDAFCLILGAYLSYQLNGDKNVANFALGRANQMIAEARKVDGNEGLTVNDVTPDWIRARGVEWPSAGGDGLTGGDWGPAFAVF